MHWKALTKKPASRGSHRGWNNFGSLSFYRFMWNVNSEAEEIKTVFLSIFKENFTLEAQAKILELLIFDKKNSHGKINFMLLKAMGSQYWMFKFRKNYLKVPSNFTTISD